MAAYLFSLEAVSHLGIKVITIANNLSALKSGVGEKHTKYYLVAVSKNLIELFLLLKIHTYIIYL